MIGFGAIGRSVVAAWRDRPIAEMALSALLVRPTQLNEARRCLPAAVVTADFDEFLAASGEVVVEAAGQGAIVQHAEAVLLAGRELFIISTGALADPGLRRRLLAVRGRIGIPAGALAGFDGLLSLRRAGLDSVRYTSAKPPLAWRGTKAEELIDLAALSVATTFFQGTASDAATLYPRNANLAASVALAGMGFEATQVELIADPALKGNVGRIEARAGDQEMTLVMSGRGSADNPKTSAITSMSILAALENRSSSFAFV